MPSLERDIGQETYGLEGEEFGEFVRFDEEAEVGEPAAQHVALTFQTLDRLLELRGLTPALQFAAGRLQEAPVGQVEGLADRQRDLLGLDVHTDTHRHTHNGHCMRWEFLSSSSSLCF